MNIVVWLPVPSFRNVSYAMLPTLRLFLEEDNRNDDDSSSKFQGLLDGVQLLEDSSDRDDLDSTLVTLADKAVGCLIKGAYAMLPKLRLFLAETTTTTMPPAHL